MTTLYLLSYLQPMCVVCPAKENAHWKRIGIATINTRDTSYVARKSQQNYLDVETCTVEAVQAAFRRFLQVQPGTAVWRPNIGKPDELVTRYGAIPITAEWLSPIYHSPPVWGIIEWMLKVISSGRNVESDIMGHLYTQWRREYPELAAIRPDEPTQEDEAEFQSLLKAMMQ